MTTLLSVVFFLSGFASLIYQVVWQRLLTVHYGVGALSITLIVSVYMSGLGIGAVAGGYLAERSQRRIVWYFAIELLLGIFGLVSLPFLAFLGRYTAGSPYHVSFLYMFAFLAFPTFLMGMTLPLLTKIFNRVVRNFLETVSFLYFINTLGAACGALFASYVLISLFGLDGGVYCAVLINFLLAGMIWRVGHLPETETQTAVPTKEISQNEVSLGVLAYPLVFVTGFLAIAYEIAWFRVVEVTVKSSPYAFSVVLSIYLLGIALGSAAMRRYLERAGELSRTALFFRLQSLVGLYVLGSFAAYYYLTRYTAFALLTRASFEGISQQVNIESPLVRLAVRVMHAGDVFLWPTLFVLVPTILMGATFPLIATLALSDRNREGQTVGIVYFFNIAGNVAGGIVTGFVLLAWLGTEMTLLTLAATGIVLGLWGRDPQGARFTFVAHPAFVAAVLIGAAVLFPRGGDLYVAMHPVPEDADTVLVLEGTDGVSVVCQRDDVVMNWINGRFQAEHPSYRSYFQAIEAMAFARQARNVLVIGYGTGSTVEAALKLPELESLVLVEVSEALITNLQELPIFDEMLSDPRLTLIVDDGRRVLLQDDRKYDLILMDPLNAATSYSNNIYSREFFELASSRMSPGGVLYSFTTERRVLPKTIASVFPEVRMYHRCCLASNEPLIEDPQRRAELLEQFSPKNLKGIELASEDFQGDAQHIEQLTRNYPLNHDWRPVCEYWIGLAIREFLYLGG